jgi:DNA-directed RNA polymerase subunit K/omega
MRKLMVERPAHLSKFEFVILSSHRAVQLLRGCTPKVDGAHKRVVIAQMEVANGLVVRAADSVGPIVS